MARKTGYVARKVRAHTARKNAGSCRTECDPTRGLHHRNCPTLDNYYERLPAPRNPTPKTVEDAIDLADSYDEVAGFQPTDDQQQTCLYIAALWRAAAAAIQAGDDAALAAAVAKADRAAREDLP